MKFERGYSKFRDKSHSRYVMSCYNCDYFYQAVGDSEDLCQNPEVLPYDIINTETSIYCLRWKAISGNNKESVNTTHFRNGVKIGRKKKVTKTRKKSR